jgi:methionyl-tRNA formyltransferase
MRIIVMGYHNIGYACLQKLIEMGADVAAVVTHADNPRENIWFKPVRDLAFEHCIPVYQPPDVNAPAMVAAIRHIAPELIFSFYFRQMLGKELLEIPRIGSFNLHGSLLPRYRGRCPVNWVLVHGEKETGVTLHRMELKPDAGAIIAQRAVPIDFKDTALTLFGKMTTAASELIADIYPKMLKGDIRELPQDKRQASYFGGRTAKDGLIDWSRSSTEIYNLVRAVTHPYPGAFTEMEARKLIVWWAEPDEDAPMEGAKPGEVIAATDGEGIRVATGKGSLILKKIQWEGESEIEAGTPAGISSLAPGTVLG